MGRNCNKKCPKEFDNLIVACKFSARKGYIKNLKSHCADIVKLKVKDLDVKNIVVENIVVENIESKNIVTENLEVTEEAKINHLTTNVLIVEEELCVNGNATMKQNLDVEGETTVVDIEVNGTAKFNGDLCVIDTGFKEDVQYPMAEIPITVDPVNDPFVTEVIANNLKFSYVPSGVEDGPWYFTDKDGNRVLQCGLEEANEDVDTLTDDITPINETDARVNITTENNLDATMKLNLSWATEQGWDFIIILKNNISIYSNSGVTSTGATTGTWAHDQITVSMLSTDILTVQFTKDSNTRSSWDSIYFYIEDLKLSAEGNSVKIETELTVEKDAHFKSAVVVEGDLCVEGHIKNVCLDLTKYCPAPTSDMVYDMEGVNQVIIAYDDLTEHTVVTDKVTKPPIVNDPQYPIFGYENDGTTLDLTGGKQYNDFVTEFGLRIHGPESSTSMVESMRQATIHTIEYLASRGHQIAFDDTVPENENTYRNRVNQAENGTGSVYISTKFVYENGPGVPSHIDLGAVSDLTRTGFTEYEPIEANRLPEYAYPMRIPITQSCDEFNEKLGSEPIIHYNIQLNQLTIDVPDTTNFLTWFDPNYTFDTPFGVPSRLFMRGFHGKFGLLRRNNNNELVRSKFSNSDVLVQISEKIVINSFIDYSGVVENARSAVFNQFSQIPGFTEEYIGIILPKMNGGSPDFDVYILNLGVTNGFSTDISPYINPETEIDNNIYGIGDNPNTTVVESLAAPTHFTVFDSPDWTEDTLGYPDTFLNNPPLPENMNTAPGPSAIPSDRLFYALSSHEYIHSLHFGTGMILVVDSEAQCTGFEMITGLNGGPNEGSMMTFRPRAYVSYITGMSRGVWPLGLSGRSYGAGMWYDYVFKKYDKNQQAVRRSTDILSSEYMTSLKNAASVDTLFEALVGGADYAGGQRLAFKQAFNEILSLNIEDIYRDSIIMTALLRNNGSIPDKYKSTYPYQVCSANYPFNNQMSSRPGFDTWWDSFDNNDQNFQASGDTQNISSANVIKWGLDDPHSLLPKLGDLNGDPFVVEDLSSGIFVLEDSLNTVTVEITQGTWSATVVQYTANVPDINGTFMQLPSVGNTVTLNAGDPPHVFDLTALTGSGLKKLVVSNLTVTDWAATIPPLAPFGKSANLFVSNFFPVTTGTANITGA